LRGYEYLEFVGSKATFLNAELRFPVIEAMLTPLGVLGGIRGVLFAGMGGGAYEGRSTDPSRNGAAFQAFSSRPVEVTPFLGTQQAFDPNTGLLTLMPVYGEQRTISGFRLVDSRASYGIGLETFALGFPVHFDWSWRTLLNKEWEDVRFAAEGGSREFRKPKFSLWIGYDF
jgi:outer membrane protein assembly factor BamA